METARTVFTFLTPLILIAINLYAGHYYNNAPENNIFEFRRADAKEHFARGQQIGRSDMQYRVLTLLSVLLIFSGFLHNWFLIPVYFILTQSSFALGVRIKDISKVGLSDEDRATARGSLYSQIGIGSVMLIIAMILLIWF